jgi:hypothetical protein
MMNRRVPAWGAVVLTAMAMCADPASGQQAQRLEALSLQLNEANAEVARVARERSDHQRRLVELEEALASGSLPPQVPRSDVEGMVSELKSTVTRLHRQETEHQARANELSGFVSIEQVRWEELNSRLDAVDQLLQGPRGTSPP